MDVGRSGRTGVPDAARALSGEVPFVGRERARLLLERWLDEALAGQPRLVVVSGPSGIGKTRLLEWLAALATTRGAQVRSGSGHAGATVPYWPFLTAFASLATTDGRAVTDLLDPPRVANVGDPLLVAGEAPDRRAIDVVDAIVDSSRATPLMLVIDDLQWADPPSLGLLSQLATAMSHRAATLPVPVMLAVGSRAGGPGEAHQRLVSSLEREPNARLLTVAGLDDLEQIALLTELGGAPPTPDLARRVAEATEGNPLLARWLLRRLLADAKVEVAGGTLHSTVAGPLTLDAGDIDDELARRLDALSAPARTLVTAASVLGDGGAVDVLAAAVGVDEPVLGDLLTELDDAGLLRDDGSTFHFAQGQLRQVALSRLSTRQRHALHLEIAAALEVGVPSAARSISIAEHLCRGRAPAARLVAVCGAAADQAFAQESWAQAAQFYEAAIEAADQLGTPGPERASWNLGAGLAHFQLMDLPRTEAQLRGAIAATADDDLTTRGRAALALVRARLTQGTPPGQMVDLSELEAFLALDHVEAREPALCALALGLMAESHHSAFAFESGFELSRRASALSTSVGDDVVSCLVELADGIQHLGVLELDDASACFRRSLEHARRRDPGLPVGAFARQALVSWLRGDLDRADDLLRRSIESTEPRQQWGEQSLATSCSVAIAALRGDHHLAERLGAQARRLCRASGYPYAALQLYPALAWSRAVRGDGAGAQEAIDEWRGGRGRGGATYRPVLQALAGGPSGDLALPAGWRDPPATPRTLLDVSSLVARIELGDALDDEALVALALPAVEALVDQGIAFALDRGSYIPRLAGVAAFRSGDLDRAEAHLVRAERSLTSSVPSPGELARCRLDRARMLIERDRRGDRREAGRLLDSAARGFDATGMMPFLEAVAVAREALPAAASSVPLSASTSTRIILVTDLVGSTALNVALGDVAYVAVLADHDRIVRARLRQLGGVEFKHTGDGFCAWFSAAGDAVAAAAGVQRDLDEWRELHPSVDLRVRSGLAAGRPVEVGGDLFGSSVALASRVCAEAADDEVLVTEEVAAALIGAPGWAGECERRGEVVLKGFPAPVAVLRVVAGAIGSTVPTDPRG